MKILIFGNASSPFILNFVKWIKIKRPTIQIHILDTHPKNTILDFYDKVIPIYNIDRLPKNKRFKKIFTFLFLTTSIVKIKKNEYDVILLHYIYPWYYILKKIIRRKSPKLIAAFWGSDIFRVKPSNLKKLGSLLNICDFIISGSPQIFSRLNDEFDTILEKNNMCYFGCEPVEAIKQLKDNNTSKRDSKVELGFNPDEIMIVVGYNISPSHQHIPILRSIAASQNLEKYSDKIHFVLPINYGELNEEYKKELKKEALLLKYKVTFITDFMTQIPIANFRNATDIFVNLQTTDSFNGTLRESFYTGSVVINGSWLPYESLANEGYYYNTVENINQIAEKLTYCLNNLTSEVTKSKVNVEKIYKISSWSKTVDNWLKVIED